MQNKTDCTFLKIRCTPSQTDPRAIKTYIDHSLRCLYGECGGAQYADAAINVLSAAAAQSVFYSEVILHVPDADGLGVDKIRAALTLPPCLPNALVPNGGYVMDVLGMERTLLNLESSSTSILNFEKSS